MVEDEINAKHLQPYLFQKKLNTPINAAASFPRGFSTISSEQIDEIRRISGWDVSSMVHLVLNKR